jgi:hypothetical protein
MCTGGDVVSVPSDCVDLMAKRESVGGRTTLEQAADCNIESLV